MKIKNILIVLLFQISLLESIENRTPWQKRHAEGWAWYHDQTISKVKEIPKQEEKLKDPIVILSIIKEDLERALAEAILEPTESNILSYMQMQKKWIDQSSTFAHLWQLNILENPELSNLVPTTQYGVQVRNRVEFNRRKSLIQNLANKDTLLYFYEGENTYSQEFSKVVKEFSKQYSWKLKPISVDGRVLTDFPESLRDRSIAQEMDIKTFPILFIVDRDSLQAIPVAFGMATINQIEENIFMQFEG